MTVTGSGCQSLALKQLAGRAQDLEKTLIFLTTIIIRARINTMSAYHVWAQAFSQVTRETTSCTAEQIIEAFELASESTDTTDGDCSLNRAQRTMVEDAYDKMVLKTGPRPRVDAVATYFKVYVRISFCCYRIISCLRQNSPAPLPFRDLVAAARPSWTSWQSSLTFSHDASSL